MAKRDYKSEYSKAFNEWWNEYPRKVAKAAAWKAWQKQIGTDDDMFADTAKVATEDLKKRTRMKWWHPDKSKIPHAATWINQRRWEDEGWEDDVKTRGKEHDAAGSTYVPRPPPIEDDYDMDSWQMMLNRVMRSYVLACGGVTDAQLASLIKIKNDTYEQNIQYVKEEISAAESKTAERAAKHEMGHLLADMMLSQFDNVTGRGLKNAILVDARRKAA